MNRIPCHGLGGVGTGILWVRLFWIELVEEWVDGVEVVVVVVGKRVVKGDFETIGKGVVNLVEDEETSVERVVNEWAEES
jgi:hypothetical protein